MAQIIKFNCLTGLRPSEAVQSAKLLNAAKEGAFEEKYYNPEREALEHFRFPKVFLRTTKKVTFPLYVLIYWISHALCSTSLLTMLSG
jgi:hypothetical protein